MSLLTYEADSSSESSSSSDIEDAFVDAEPEELIPTNIKESKKTTLPPPKTPMPAPAPPAPIPMLPPKIAKEVLDAQENQEENVFDVDADELHTENTKLAESNMMVRDRTIFKGVGTERSKSQLTYLAKLDLETRGAFEQQMARSGRSRAASAKAYGW